MFSRTGHSIEVLGFALGEPHPPRRARTFVGQTAGCRTKVHLAPVRRRVQFRHSQRTIPLSKRQLRNEKSRAYSPLQYYEDPQGLKNAVVGHARPPEPPPKNRMTLRADGFKPTHDGMDIDGKKISPNKYFRIYRFPEFWKYPSEKRFMHIHGYSAENPTRQIIAPSNHQTMKTSDQQTSGSWDISICNQEGRCRQIRSYDASCLLSVLHLQVLVVDCDYPQWSMHPRIGYQIYWILF